MANKKINDLTAAGAVASTMQLETDIGGATANKITLAQVDSYVLTGKAGGRTLTGGSAASENLTLESTSNGTKGLVQIATGTTLRAHTTNYEALVLTNNDIPNKKYVDDAITTENLWDKTLTTLSPHTAGDSVDLNTGSLTATILTSTQTTGTAPLTVASTTVVSNLNAEQWNGVANSVSAPSVDQVLSYNGSTWVNKNPTAVSAGLGVYFYLDDTSQRAVSVNNDNEVVTLSKTPITTTEVIDSISCASNTVLKETYWISSAVGTTSIPAGEWLFDTYCAVSSVLAGRVSSIKINIMRSRTEAGTVTITGSGTSRTCNASTGTPFATTKIDTGGTLDSDSYIITPNGMYRITARASDTEVTIETPSGYGNESTVAFTVLKRLFQYQTSTITNLNTSGYNLKSERSVQSAFTVLATDGLAAMYFGVSNNTTTVYFTHNGNSRYSNFRSTLTLSHNDLVGLYGNSPYYHFDAGSLATDSGMTISSYTLALGTPSSCSSITTNAVTGSTHTHEITGIPTLGAPVADAYTPTLGQTAFTLSQTPRADYLFLLTLNGAIQLESTDFTVSGTSLTWLNAGGITLKTTDSLVARYYY
jgi:hypothetical protein